MAGPERPSIRLSYFFGAPWKVVLERLAEETNSTLVRERIPAGRFVRRDRDWYTRTEAVRILNRDLEAMDFRLLERGDHLVLLHLRSTRTRYERPLVPSLNPSPSRASTKLDRANRYRSEVKTITRRQPRPTPLAPDGVIRRVDHEQAIPTESRPPVRSRLVVTLEHRTAAELARTLFSAFLPDADLVDKGPDGLPAFRVLDQPARRDGDKARRFSSEPVSRFIVGIDETQNRLVVDGPSATARTVARLIRILDSESPDDRPTLHVRRAEKDAARIVRNIQPVVDRLVVAGRNQPAATGTRRSIAQRPKTDDDPKAKDDPKTDDDPKPKDDSKTDDDSKPNDDPKPKDDSKTDDDPKPETEPDRPEPPLTPQQAILGGLRGEVKIEVLPDGRIVIYGNEDDVQKVLALIDLLEAGGAPTVPDIEIAFLRHVNSEALSGLLTSVYQSLSGARGEAGQRTSSINIIPIVRPNAILVIAPIGDLEAVMALAAELDEPHDPEQAFEVFQLAHAPAFQVATMLEDIYQEGQERPGLSPRIVVYADVRTNSIVVQASPRDLEEIAALVRKMDRDRSPAVSRLKIIPLNHAVAEELSETLNLAIQSVINPAQPPQGAAFQGAGAGAGAAQAAQQLRSVKSAVLELLGEEGGEQLVRSGVLADIRINPEVRTNSLVVTAPEASMKMVETLIARLDKPTSIVADIKHFMLEHADATSVAELLAELFTSDAQGGQGGQVGIDFSGAEGASSSIVPLRFSVDVRTNSIFAVGGREALEVVEAVVTRLDESDIRQRKSIVYRLNNSPAVDVANAINQFLQSQRDLQQIDPDLVSPFEQIEREVIVVAEPITNTLIISATPRYYDEVFGLILDLDRPQAQVTIQAMIVEVELNQTDEFGVEIGFQDSVLFNRGTVQSISTISSTQQQQGNAQTIVEQIVSSEGLPGFNFNRDILGNNTLGVGSRPGKVGSQALSNFQVGRINGDLGFGGLVLSAGSESVNILIRALASNRRVEVLSRPLIQALDNQQAQIHVGQEVPRIDGFQPSGVANVNTPLVVQDQVGITLTVTPRVSPDGQVVMEVVAEKSQLAAEGGITLITDFQTGTGIESPVKDIAEARATVSVRDGQTIVLGGMITRTENTVERKVPWIGDIPLLGTAFRYDSHSVRRTELIIFLTPKIVKQPEDFELQKKVEAERLHFMIEDAEAMHGPILSVPLESDAKPPQGKKSQGKKSQGKKSQGKKSRGKKSRGKKSQGKKSQGKKSQGKKSPRAPTGEPSGSQDGDDRNDDGPTTQIDGKAHKSRETGRLIDPDDLQPSAEAVKSRIDPATIFGRNDKQRSGFSLFGWPFR